MKVNVSVSVTVDYVQKFKAAGISLSAITDELYRQYWNQVDEVTPIEDLDLSTMPIPELIECFKNEDAFYNMYGELQWNKMMNWYMWRVNGILVDGAALVEADQTQAELQSVPGGRSGATSPDYVPEKLGPPTDMQPVDPALEKLRAEYARKYDELQGTEADAAS